MPSIKCQDTVEVLAKAFMSNGLVKSLALRTAGYKKTYSEHGGLKLFDDVRVKAAIAKIQAKRAALSEIEAKELTKRFNLIAEKASLADDNVNACRANENLGKHIGYFEADNRQKQVNVVQAITSGAEMELLEKRLARLRQVEALPDAVCKG